MGLKQGNRFESDFKSLKCTNSEVYRSTFLSSTIKKDVIIKDLFSCNSLSKQMLQAFLEFSTLSGS